MPGTILLPLNLPQVTPIPRETLQDTIYEQLVDLILDGEIAPGELVTIQRLADAFGTSTTPVREALKRLAAANVLTVVSGRSVGVPPLSADRLSDLLRVRREIEPLAAGWAAGRIDTAVLSRVEARLDDMKAAVAADDINAFLRANRVFHFEIYRAAGSPTLEAIIETLWLQISPFFHLLGRAGGFPVNNIEHEAMMVALRAGDADALQASLRRDIDIGCQVILDLLR